MTRLASQRTIATILGLVLIGAAVSRPGGAQSVGTDTLVFAPVADTFVESSNPGTNYDDDARLRADADPDRIIYLRFVVTGLAGRLPAAAQLRLHVSGPSDDTGGTLWLVTDDTWDAAAVTYATRPPLDGPVLDTIGSVASDTIVEFDLGGAVTGDGAYSFGISSTSDDSVTYVSTAAAQGRPPELVLHMPGAQPGAAPIVTIVQPPGGATFYRGDPVPLQAVVTDDIDPRLGDLVEWRSDHDGALGIGGTIAPMLTAGDHAVSASVTDSDGLTGSDRVTVAVVPPPAANTEPLVTITAPLDGETFTAAEAVGFAGTANDLEDGPLTSSLSWTSDRDGTIGQGGGFATVLSEGVHDVTARAADGAGLEGSATVRVSIAAPAGPLRFLPVADTYVRANDAGTNYGTRGDLRLDTSPEQIAYLRFVVAGIGPRAIARATLRMTVASGGGASSDHGGTLHAISDDGWDETTVTYDTRPAIDGPALDGVGAVSSGAVVDFDVTAAVVGDGTYTFALRSTSNNNAVYRSREAGGPLLILAVHGHAPVVTITAPPTGTEVSATTPITLEATAMDVEDGDLAGGIVWTSDRDGPLGAGARLTTALGEGTHRVTAAVTDADGATGSDDVIVVVTPAVPVPTGALVFEAVADTYVDADAPRDALGAEDILRIDDSPRREAYLRFAVAGIRPFAVDQAILRLTVGTESTHGSSSGGSVRALLDSGWSEATTTYSNRPAVGGPALATAGSVEPGAVLDLDVRPALRADGTYDFALTTTSGDAAGYVSREAGVGGPRLILTLKSNLPPTVAIIAPPPDAIAIAGQPTTLVATASDTEDGDLRAGVSWRSDRDGPLGTGATLGVTTLRPGGHTITAEVTDSSGAGDAATIDLTIEAPPAVSIVAPGSGSTYFTDERITLSATAIDVGDGDLGASIRWSSDRDGPLGGGASITASLSAGAHVITAAVTDSHGLAGSDSIGLLLEVNDPPAVTITAPASGGQIVEGSPLTLAATADDPEDGDLSASITWHSDRDGALGAGSTIVASSLSVGTHTLTARVTDRRGLLGSATVAVSVLFNEPPVIAIAAPADGLRTFSGNPVTFAGTATDREDGDLTATLSWTSDRDGVLGRGPGFTLTTLRRATHRITVEASDAGGKIGRQTITVAVDAIPSGTGTPTVTITAPADGTTLASGLPLRFSATATDPDDGNIGSSIVWRSDRDGEIGRGASVTTTALSVGLHRVTATATDRHGVTRLDAIDVDITQGAPVVTILLPVADGGFLSGMPVDFFAEAIDVRDGDLSATITWRSDLDGALGAGRTITVGNLGTGTHTVTASATNGRGLTGTGEVRFVVARSSVSFPAIADTYVDEGVPTTSFGTHSELLADAGPNVRETYLRFAVGGIADLPIERARLELRTTSKGASSFAGIVHTLSGAAWTESTTFATRPSVSGPPIATNTAAVGDDRMVEFDVRQAVAGEGTYDFAIVTSSSDAVKYRSRESSSGRPALVLDLATPQVERIPAITITSPAGALTAFDDASVAFSAAASDAEDGDLTAAIVWRSTIDGPLGTGGSVTRLLSRGTHTVSATVRDSFGLAAVATVEVEVLDRPPAVAISSPASGAFFPSGFPIAFAATATDDRDGNLSATIEWRSHRSGVLGTGPGVTASALSPGDHLVTATARNTLGTLGSATVTIFVDQAPPVVTITAPQTATVLGEGALVTCLATAHDVEDGDLSHALGWASDLEGFLGTGPAVPAVLTLVGTHRISATVTDSHGFTRSDSVEVTVVPAGPVVTILSPGDATSIVGPIAFAATAIDARDGDRSAGIQWTSSIDGAIGNGPMLASLQLSPGFHTITAAAGDLDGLVGTASIAIAVGAPPPVVEILAPIESAGPVTETQVALDAPVSLVATARDAVGEDLGAVVTWRSDLNGPLGAGAALTVTTLVRGRHVITAEATDQHGLTGSAHIVLVVDVAAGGIGPLIHIALPEPGTELEVGTPIALRATATDGDGTDVSSRLSWVSSLEGLVGTGGSLTTTLDSIGSHTITVAAAGASGLVGSATVTVVAGPPALHFPATADASVDPDEPATNFGLAPELAVGGPASARAYLRFVVDGIGALPVREAVVRLQTTAQGPAGSDHGGTIHVVDRAWQETTLTASNAPAVTTPALDDAGPVVPGETVTFDVTSAIAGNGVYAFAIATPSADRASYRSREAGIGRPELIVSLEPPPPQAPTVSIAQPAHLATLPVGVPARFVATATDAQDGDIAPAIIWESNIRGKIVRGPSVSFTLSPGTHTITAWANDVDGNTGADVIHVLVGDAPVVEITSPSDGAVAPFGETTLLSATAFDPQDGDLSSFIQWISDLDGPLGSGPSGAPTLSPGSHTITARVTDLDGNVGSATVGVRIRVEDVGFRDFAFGGGVDEDANRVTGAKPESKLWHMDGVWWGTLFAPASGTYTIHRLDLATQTWIDTGVLVDERPTSRQDALLDGETLYMVSRMSGQGGQNRLLRYTYHAAVQTFVRDPGFPVDIPGGGTESVTIAKDSTGRLWIAYTLGDLVMVSHSVATDTQWAAPFVVPVDDEDPLAAQVYWDDIAAVQALDGAIGIMWSNQLTKEVYFAVHRDGASPTDPAAWTLEVAATGGSIADDHLNMKLAPDGRLFAAVKTSYTGSSSTLIGLLVRSPAGLWSELHHVASERFATTRPLCLLDAVRRRVHVFYSPSEGAIYTKSSDMDVIDFPEPNGVGSPFITSSATSFLNNPTSTKQTVTPSTGLVVLAASTTRYFHNTIEPEAAPVVTITDPADGTAVMSGQPLGLMATAFSVADGILTDAILWSSSIDGALGNGGAVTAALSDGTHVVTASARDRTLLSGHASITVHVAAEAAPELTITTPHDGARVLHGTPVTFTGTAVDLLDGELTAAIDWRSDRDGSLGTGGSVTAPALSTGTHVITASAIDGAGLVGRASIAVDVQDPAPPIVNVTIPLPDAVASLGATVTFAGTAHDAFDGDLTASLRWSSSLAGAIGTGGTFSRSSLGFGVHTITATVTDSHGLTASASTTVTVGDVPRVTITSPAEGAVFTEGTTITLRATATDVQDGDLGPSIAWASTTDGPLGTGTTIAVASLSPGPQTIIASATDSHGSRGETRRRLTIRGKPRIAIVSPAPGASLEPGTPVTLAATATDVEDGDLSATVRWTSDVEGTLGTGASITTAAFVAAGPRTLTASVTDSAGFRTEARVDVLVNAAPSIAIVRPLDGAAFEVRASVAFDASAADPEDGNVTAAIRWTSDVDGALGTGGSITRSSLGPGTHVVTATVTDSGGQTASDSVAIFINAAPTVAITSPTDGTVIFVDDQPVRLTGQATDTAGNDLSAGIVWTSSVDGSLGSGARRDVVLGVGQHTVTATATDAAGRSRSATLAVRVRAPNLAPGVTIEEPADGVMVPAGTVIDLAAGALDDFDGDVSGAVVWDSDTGGRLGFGRRITVTLGEGAHVITARATDSDGATGSASATVLVTPTPPAVAIVAPPSGVTVIEGDPVTFTASALDATDGELSSALAWTSDLQGLLGTGGAITAALTAGHHAITAAVQDAKGLEGRATITVVAGTRPSVSIAAPAAGLVALAQDPLVLGALAWDVEDGDVSDRIAWTSDRDGALGTGMLVVAGLSVGPHTLRAHVTDHDGAAATAQVAITVVDASRRVLAAADTYVDSGTPATALGAESTFRVDSAPERQAFLRFEVPDLGPYHVRAARLLLTVGPRSSHASSSGGTVHGISDLSWTEATTFAARPAIDGPALATLGAVDSDEEIEIDVGGVVTGAGSYGFGLVTTSSDGVGYQSREASTGRPALELLLGEDGPPVVVIVSPSGVPASAGPVLLRARALDAEAGNLDVVWSSDLQGPLGTGGDILVALTPGRHVLAASASDGTRTGTAELALDVVP
jgi:hypothetical protein